MAQKLNTSVLPPLRASVPSCLRAFSPLRASRRRRTGFTLIEAALTTVIVGTGVLAIVSAQQAYHIKNEYAARTGTAQLLANELRELTLSLPVHDPVTGIATLGPEGNETSVADYDDLDDFAGTISGGGVGSGTTFDPPINALRQPISAMDRWSQVIEVRGVLPGYLNAQDAVSLGLADMFRVTVTVFYRDGSDTEAQPATTLTWVVTR